MWFTLGHSPWQILTSRRYVRHWVHFIAEYLRTASPCNVSKSTQIRCIWYHIYFDTKSTVFWWIELSRCLRPIWQKPIEDQWNGRNLNTTPPCAKKTNKHVQHVCNQTDTTNLRASHRVCIRNLWIRYTPRYKKSAPYSWGPQKGFGIYINSNHVNIILNIILTISDNDSFLFDRKTARLLSHTHM